MERLEKIAILDDQMQAQLVEAVLSDRGIPHVLRTYRDSAYDGLFQTQKGWSVILAPPPEHRDEILTVLADLRRTPESPSED